MKIVGILQARCSSSRFPNKVMKEILGLPMVWHQWQRILLTQQAVTWVLATSVDPSDDLLAQYFLDREALVFRGSLHHVLQRYYHCAFNYQADQIIRLTGDCPLAQATLIDELLKLHLEGDYDYTYTNSDFPHGLDVEVINMASLKIAYERATTQFQQEHVTAFVRDNPQQFKINKVISSQNLSAVRIVVDYPEDFEVIDQIYQALYPTDPNFALPDILAFFSINPDIRQINSVYTRDKANV